MKNILIISGHPRISHSTANRTIIEQLITLPGVTVCDIMSSYPDGNIDTQSEQKRLAEAELIVLQFPFTWYGMPSHMKCWMENVFTYGFAYGEGGSRLKNKKLLLSVTLGGSRMAYSERGQHLYPVETFLLPLELFAKYCGMHYLPPVYSYEMATAPNTSTELVEEKALMHAQRIATIISALQVKRITSSSLMESC